MWGWAENLCSWFLQGLFIMRQHHLLFQGQAREHMLSGLAHKHMLMGQVHEHVLKGKANEHVLMCLAHEHMQMGLAHEHMLMEPDPGPNELKSWSGQPIRTAELEVAN